VVVKTIGKNKNGMLHPRLMRKSMRILRISPLKNLPPLCGAILKELKSAEACKFANAAIKVFSFLEELSFAFLSSLEKTKDLCQIQSLSF